MKIYNDVQQADTLWLGKVPLQWVKSRLKDVVKLSPSFSNGKPDEFEECTVVPMELVSRNGSVNLEYQLPFSDIAGGLTIFESKDVLFAKITPCMENGKGAYIEKLKTRYALGSTEFHVLRPSHKVDGKFIYYYTYNKVFRDYAEVNMSGAAGQKRVSSKFISSTRIYLPTIGQQQVIVEYLDQSCKTIDSVIKIKQQQLEKLEALRKSTIYKAVTKGLDDSVEMVDSDIECIGPRPIHWDCLRIKRVSKRIQTGSTPPTSRTDFYVDGSIPWYAPASFKKSLELDEPIKLINANAYYENKLRVFNKGTVFWIGIGATIGKVAIIRKNASCNQQVIGIEANHSIYPEFLGYFMKFYEDIIPKIAQYTTLPIMDQVKVGYLHLVRPPMGEQIAICSYLEKRLDFIAKLNTNLNRQIETLSKYKKSLINECVTGKRNVIETNIK